MSASVLKQAIRERLQVTGYYDGHYREFCPHEIGWKRAKDSDQSTYNVFVYQFGGSTSSGPIPYGGEWKCFRVDGLTQIAARKGQWHTATTTRRGTCVDLNEA